VSTGALELVPHVIALTVVHRSETMKPRNAMPFSKFDVLFCS